MPTIAIPLSIVSMIPFVVCGLAAAGGHTVTAEWMLSALISYAALMLAFAGGRYWALVLPSRDGMPGSAMAGGGTVSGVRRVLMGAVPVLLAWAALLTAGAFPGWTALPILIVGHAGAVLTEHQAGLLATLPRSHVVLRWSFAAVAVAMLTTVLMLRITGSTIAF